MQNSLATDMDDDLEAICDLIFEMACDVNKACFYLADSSVEKQYQACMAFEMNKAKLNYHSETHRAAVQGLPPKDVRADFVLNPVARTNSRRTSSSRSSTRTTLRPTRTRLASSCSTTRSTPRSTPRRCSRSSGSDW